MSRKHDNFLMNKQNTFSIYLIFLWVVNIDESTSNVIFVQHISRGITLAFQTKYSKSANFTHHVMHSKSV